MRNLKLVGILVFIMMVLAIPNRVNAVDRKDIIKIIAPDGVNAVLKMKKPTTENEGDYKVGGYISMALQGEGYEAYGYCYGELFDECCVTIRSEDYESVYDKELRDWVITNGWQDIYTINVTYEEPEANSAVNEIIGSLKKFNQDDYNTYYYIEDLSLINYYLTSDKSELWNVGASGRAIKYSTINKIIKGSNVSFYLDIRAGDYDENYLYEYVFGNMSTFYKGYSYNTQDGGLYLKKVIYIPQETEDTKEAYIEAAQNRINDYLDNDDVKVTYGGLISSLGENAEDVMNPMTSDGNYYNINIGKKTYKFYIIKGTDEQLVQPVYTGLDLEHNIEITSDDSRIPLDTSLNVKTVEDSLLKDKIGTENYKSYDIILHSASKNAKIEKLENGKFLVKMPIPIELENKELIVYYITEEGKIEEHQVTVKDGFVTFTTDHFSTYTLAEKVNVSNESQSTIKPTTNNPQTDDNIGTNIIMLFINILGIAILSYIYFRNQKDNNNS